MPLSVPLKSVLYLRIFGRALEVLVLEYTSRTFLEDQTDIWVSWLKNSPSQGELPACFGWVMGRWTGAPRAADRSDSSINIFQQPNKPWRHVTNSLFGDKRFHLKWAAWRTYFIAVTVASRSLHRQLGRSAFILFNYFALKSFGLLVWQACRYCDWPSVTARLWLAWLMA